MGTCKDILRGLWKYRSQLVVLLAPLVLLPMPIVISTPAGFTGYTLVLAGVYWVTEALPLAVTALLPVVLLPMFGVLTTKEVCTHYLETTTMMFLGGLVVALSIEKCNLHKRIALGILKLVGAQTRWLILGFMVPSWFLSMWISNTATTAMMLPIVEAVMAQIELADSESEVGTEGVEGHDNIAMSTLDEEGTKIDANANEKGTPNGTLAVKVNDKSSSDLESSPAQEGGQDDEFSKMTKTMGKGLTLAVCYAANIGGVGTLTGTTPNLVMKGVVDEIWEKRGVETPVSFATWMIFGFPTAFLLLIISWLWMHLYFMGWRSLFGCGAKKEKSKKEAALKKMIDDEYAELGPLRYAEGVVLFLFVSMVLLWFFREPQFMPGWASPPGLKKGFVADAVPAIFITLILFIVPSQFPRCGSAPNEGNISGGEEEEESSTGVDCLMDWDTVQHKLPWSVIILLGGGFALADACTKSGLSGWIGDQLTVFGDLPPWVMILLLCLMVSLLTEVTSNTASCTLMMPIMASMADSLGMNPLYLMFPVAVSTSFAFLLPVSTAPNAIAFSFGRITVPDMIKAGIPLKIFGVLGSTLAAHTWGMAYFQLNVLPWPAVINGTTVDTLTTMAMTTL